MEMHGTSLAAILGYLDRVTTNMHLEGMTTYVCILFLPILNIVV